MYKIDMNKVQSGLNKGVAKIQRSKLVNGITGGMMSAMPITILGAFAALFLNIPLDSYKQFINNYYFADAFKLLITFTTNFLAVIFCFTIAGNYAKQHNEDATFCGLIALICFFIVTPINYQSNNLAELSTKWLGGTGIFTGIVVSLVSTNIYLRIKKKGYTIKMPASVPPVVSDSFSSLIPGFISIILFVIVSILFNTSMFGSFHQFIYTTLQIPLQGASGHIISIILLWTFGQILWFMGIHGTMVIYSVVLPIFTAMDAVQLAAYSAGEALPNITGRSFVSTYTMAASAIGLTLLMLFTAKSQQYKKLGKLTSVPSLFGISEPLVFGTPMVFNFKFIIPFIFMNGICLSIAYCATYIGLVPRVAGITPITGMPIILSGIMEGSWKIAALQVFLVCVQIVCWYPFFKKADNQALKEEIKREEDKKLVVNEAKV